MNNDTMWITNPDVILREEMDDWALLFDAATGQVVGINPVGSAIWKLLDGKHSLQQVASKVENEFVGAPENLSIEIQTFFDSLIKRGFIGKLAS